MKLRIVVYIYNLSIRNMIWRRSLGIDQFCLHDTCLNIQNKSQKRKKHLESAFTCLSHNYQKFEKCSRTIDWKKFFLGYLELNAGVWRDDRSRAWFLLPPHSNSKPFVTPVPGHLVASFDLYMHQALTWQNGHTCRQNTHRNKNFKIIYKKIFLVFRMFLC